jgi:hypothetical protein
MTHIRKYWAVVALVLIFAAGVAMRELAPLPVHAFGPSVSGTVSVDNFPATQNVSGTVGVGNFPATQNVNVTNPATSPALVRDVDNAARNAITFALNNPTDTFVVPSGKRLVVEQISALPGGAFSNIAILVTTLNGADFHAYLTPDPTGPYRFTGRLYADPLTNVSLNPGSATGQFSVSGYLIDYP